MPKLQTLLIKLVATEIFQNKPKIECVYCSFKCVISVEICFIEKLKDFGRLNLPTGELHCTSLGRVQRGGVLYMVDAFLKHHINMDVKHVTIKLKTLTINKADMVILQMKSKLGLFIGVYKFCPIF